MAEDYYKTLGLSRSASPDEIAKAYRSLARKYHPDLNPDDAKAKQQFQRVQVAYDTLHDAEKRKLYDQYGEGYEAYRNGPFGGSQSGPSGFDFREAFGNSEGFQFFDFFQGAGPGAQASGARGAVWPPTDRWSVAAGLAGPGGGRPWAAG